MIGCCKYQYGCQDAQDAQQGYVGILRPQCMALRLKRQGQWHAGSQDRVGGVTTQWFTVLTYHPRFIRI